MERSLKLKWGQGLQAAYSSLDAIQRDRYSWVAKTTTTNIFVFSIELDHKNTSDNAYSPRKGTFTKRVPPMLKSLGHEPQSISHSKELFEAVSTSYEDELECRILFVRGTKYGNKKPPIRAAADKHFWQVTELTGNVEKGYSFTIARIERVE